MSHLHLFANIPLSVTPSQKKETLSAKDKVLSKLDADLKALESITDIDDLGYGTIAKDYKNKKGEKVLGRMKSWSGRPNANGKREIRLTVGTAIAFSGGKRIQMEVDNTVGEVRKGLKFLRGEADKINHTAWEEIATEMAKVNKERRERKEANKRKKK